MKRRPKVPKQPSAKKDLARPETLQSRGAGHEGKPELVRIPHLLTEDGWAYPPKQVADATTVEKLKAQLFGRIRERVFEKLNSIPEYERAGEDLVSYSAYSTGLLVLLARTSDLAEAIAELHNIKVKDGIASTMDDARKRLVVTKENFPTELSILKDFYGRIAAKEDVMEICGYIQMRLAAED